MNCFCMSPRMEVDQGHLMHRWSRHLDNVSGHARNICDLRAAVCVKPVPHADLEFRRLTLVSSLLIFVDIRSFMHSGNPATV
jgi:hypothetical protein